MRFARLHLLSYFYVLSRLWRCVPLHKYLLRLMKPTLEERG